jgi:biotin operon repressor
MSQTRATHHADSKSSTVKNAKDQIAWLVERRCTKQEAISSTALADATGLKPTTVRDCIKEIRSERDIPIVSCSNGYYVIASVNQLERELERIQSEINTRKETKSELVAAFNKVKYE